MCIIPNYLLHQSCLSFYSDSFLVFASYSTAMQNSLNLGWLRAKPSFEQRRSEVLPKALINLSRLMKILKNPLSNRYHSYVLHNHPFILSVRNIPCYQGRYTHQKPQQTCCQVATIFTTILSISTLATLS